MEGLLGTSCPSDVVDRVFWCELSSKPIAVADIPLSAAFVTERVFAMEYGERSAIPESLSAFPLRREREANISSFFPLACV